MPILVPHAELAARLGTEHWESHALTVAELLEEAGRAVDPAEWSQAIQCTLLLNGRNIHYLKGFGTLLSADDVVWMVVPSGGG